MILSLPFLKPDEVEKSRGTHLDHTNRVTRAVEKFSNCFPELKGIESGLKASALYHDIGKTGDNDDPKIQYSIMRLFSLYQENEAEKNEAEESSSKKKMFDMTIEEALEMHDPEEKEAILKIIGAIGLQEKDLMRKVYQSHVTEGINILKKNKFKPEIIYLVGNHHSKSNNFNYDNLPQIDDFPEEERESLEIGSTILELIDSFEASRYRGKSNDQDNFFRLREIYANDVLANKIIDKMEENIGIINEAFESCE